MSAHVDGNVLAGPLSELFNADMTMALGTCAGCGDSSPLALALVYLKPKAFIVRCHLCDAVLMTLVQNADENWIDLEGFRGLRIARTG